MKDKNMEFKIQIEELLFSSIKISQINNLLREIQSNEVYIYGAGNVGNMTYNLLKKFNIDINGFIDRKADTVKIYMNKPVYKIEDKTINKENTFIIIAFYAIMKSLKI
ncbi:hypothetical protein PL321_10880 [Caloramator sp. mosi_1]|uniref:hypothetical protein n=1 Tax=Caloramator sp. mosi_1 TaxID=3023090 RepID=UPI0023627D0C|nr:hypothetical protein [Caloramator sp. mosi_1]WDC83280.1 hypothetical protein PL321_10880 [Caloramator sp. mosi_1]